MHHERRVKRERNQQDATNLMFIISTCFGYHYAHHQENKSVHCRIWCSVLVVMAMVVWSWDASCVHLHSAHSLRHQNQCRTPYAAVHTLVLLVRGIMMPETCWDKSLIINITLVASCRFLSLRLTFVCVCVCVCLCVCIYIYIYTLKISVIRHLVLGIFLHYIMVEVI